MVEVEVEVMVVGYVVGLMDVVVFVVVMKALNSGGYIGCLN